MRIIAGELKGRQLRAPSWAGLRPTSDRLRETLFNVLAPRVVGARFLDGYAGTGAVGIEALSRGASRVVFVEQDPRAARLVESNLRLCGVENRYAIIRSTLAEAVGRLAGERFDLAFLDPPYGTAGLEDALRGAAQLDADLVIVEHARRDPAPAAWPPLLRSRELRSGDSALAFYRRSPAQSAEGA